MKNKNRYFLSEFIGSCFLVMIIVGSGLMAENLTNDTAVMLIANTIATGAGLFVLITVFADVSGSIQGNQSRKLSTRPYMENEEFVEYCKDVVLNAKVLAQEFINLGYDIVTGGTDTHIVLIDLTSKSISGKKAENILEEWSITTNKNMVPYDQRSPLITSGIRVGTPALTTRGMGESEMKIIAGLIDKVLSNINNKSKMKEVRNSVLDLCNQFPLYKEKHHEMS